MPIHLRAEPGDYAEACLLPGDPLRATFIAETFLTDVVQVNAERGLLGYTGLWEGKPVSVQGTGMGCPGATIVFEELIQLGVRRLLRVGTCGGLQRDQALGDLIVAISAVPADATATHLVGGEPHCPTASWELIHEDQLPMRRMVDGALPAGFKGFDGSSPDVLKADTRGSDIVLSINGQQVGSFNTRNYHLSGDVGFYLETFDEAKAHVHFDELTVTALA